MKRNIYTLVLLCSVLGFSTTYAQKNVGIGTTTPDNSAVLDINSSDKGLLIPRMSLQQRNAINNPADGLMVYQTGEQGGFYFFEGKTNEWKPITEAKAVAGTDGDWTLLGNAAGPNDFIGTTNAQPLRFKVSNQNAGIIDQPSGNVLLGYQSGQNITTGIRVAGLGYQVLNANTTGSNSVGIGFRALFRNTVGNENFAMGTSALEFNTSGNSNFGFGSYALYQNNTGFNNVALGQSAMQFNTSGANNTAIGLSAMRNATTGILNVAVGSQALRENAGGSRNTGVGYGAGYSSGSGSDNIFIGYNAGYTETGNNKLYIANSATATPLIYGDFTAKFVAIGEIPASDAKRKDAAAAGYNLLVKGGILTEKVKVALVSTTDWADYVFENTYSLMPLEEVESFTKKNKHLPNVPSAEEMINNGLDVSQTSKMFMEKIEELTLYMIEMNKEIKALKAENELLKKQN